MADTVWPPGLTQAPLVARLRETTPDLVVRSQMSQGPAKVRRRFTAGVRLFDVELAVTRAQLATFDAFFTDTIEGGALTFEWKHPRTGAAADFRIVGQPVYAPKAARQSGAEYWAVSFSMELVPAGSSASGGGDNGAAPSAYFDDGGGADGRGAAGAVDAEEILLPVGLDDDVPPSETFWPYGPFDDGGDGALIGAGDGGDAMDTDITGSAVPSSSGAGGGIGTDGA